MNEYFFTDDVSSNDLFSLSPEFILEDGSRLQILSVGAPTSEGSETGSVQDPYSEEVLLCLSDIRSLLSTLLFVTICAFLIPWIKGIFKGFLRGGKD